jgi:two-component system cell cycle response regulator
MSDVRMDDGDGYDLLREVIADPVLQQIPFILITSAATDEEERSRGLDMGADRYLFRPIAPNALRTEIEACVRERLAATTFPMGDGVRPGLQGANRVD